MKFREHRASLTESIETVVEIEPTLVAVTEAIVKSLRHFPAARVSQDRVRVEPYAFDARIGWNTHIVTLDGYGVLGFTDGPIGPVAQAKRGFVLFESEAPCIGVVGDKKETADEKGD